MGGIEHGAGGKTMDQEKAKNLDDLLKQISDFEGTIKGLQDNVAALKKKIVDNQAKYGPDIANWPKD
jgi:peptidoglycan hydrolase CwlO-like protein